MNARLGASVGLALCAVMSGVCASEVRADGITLDRYSPAELPADGFAVSRPDDLGSGRVALQLHLDHANDPLVLELEPGSTGSEQASIVRDHMVLHVGLAVGLGDRLVLFGGGQANLWMAGDTFVDPATGARQNLADGTGAGDAHAGARLRLAGARDDVGALALSLRAGFPVAKAMAAGQRFSGEGGVTLLPELLAELRPGILRVSASVGARVRKDVSLPNAPVNDELPFGLGLTLRLAEGFDAIAELYGETGTRDLFGRESTPLEALAGGKLWLASRSVVLGVAGGPGLNRGVGAPDYRLVVLLGYQQGEDEPGPSPAPELPAPAPRAPRDRDGDGLLDRDDECPLDPEDEDGFRDRDGCPDPDNDQDGIPDERDECPRKPEDTDGFADRDGCPDPDNDGDRLRDEDDECVNDAEDRDNYEDQDGCPDPDNDNDSVLDADDQCPLDPGPPSDKGCPRVRVEEGQIRIMDRVEFATNKDVILKRSEPILQAVRDVLDRQEQLARVRVEGHTDNVGKDKKNLDLSRRRAKSVMRWLTAHGVDAQRLEAWGCGELHPLELNDTADGRQLNRRVEFHILTPPTPGAEPWDDCAESK